MKIQYLSDVKKALQDIPDEALEVMGWGNGEDSDGVDIMIWDDDYISKWEECNKKYPQIVEIGKWIKNIQKAQSVMEKDKDSDEFDWMEEPISSDYEFK